MKKKIMALTAALIIAISAFAACTENKTDSKENDKTGSSIVASDVSVTVDAADYEVGYDESSACKIAFNETTAEVNGQGADWEDGKLTISKAGTYILSGKLTDGRVVVKADKNDIVRLILKGADITSSTGSPLTVMQADKVSITLDEKSENKLSDAGEYKLSGDEENVDACIFSKDDLTINGSGSLTISANYKHGIVSKDDLVITGGKLTVTSKSTGISGKDSVKITGGEFDISAGTNGVKADNTEDASKGYIAVSGGSFKIVSNNDAFEAETVLKVDDGTFDVTTGGGSVNSSTKQDGKPNENWQKNMNGGGGGMRGGRMGQDMQSKQSGQIPQGEDRPQMPDAQTPPQMPDGQQPPDGGNGQQMQKEPVPADAQNVSAVVDNTANADPEKSSDSSTSVSAKAFKAGGDLEITGGTFKIDSADDSIHSNSKVNITGGKFTISSGDDGIHADKDLTISGGELTISKSYEGIEGLTTTISGGKIDVTASDDGINCAGGSDTGSNERSGRNEFAAQEGVYLKITGGELTVNSNGDGLDSNGDLYVEGGTTVVYGPTNSGNGALDYNGKATVTGGSLIALGATGMEQNFSDTSTQCSVLVDFDSVVSKDTELTIKDKDGKSLFTVKDPKTWQGVVFTSPDIKQGETYTLAAGSSTKTVEVTATITGGGNGAQQFGGGRMK